MDELLAAMGRKDADGVAAALAPDVVLRSPISTRVEFRGREAVRDVLRGVYAVVGPVTVGDSVGTGDVRVAHLRSSIGGQQLDEAMLARLRPDGLVSELTLFMRPMPATVSFAARLGPVLARRRGRARAVAVRALFAPLAALVRRGEPVGLRLVAVGTRVRSRST